MDNCIFCKIIKGEIPCYKIYEDDKTLAFLDIAGDFLGHILVIPKNHCKNLLDADKNDYLAVMETVQKISKHYVKNCKFAGVNILNANNEEAEQSVFHLHIHIIPRLKDDNLHIFPKSIKQNFNLEDIAKKLSFKDNVNV